RSCPVTVENAVAIEAEQKNRLTNLAGEEMPVASVTELPSPIVGRLSAASCGEDIVNRVAGDHFLPVEYGPLALDTRLRFRAHALMQWLQKNALPGVREDRKSVV